VVGATFPERSTLGNGEKISQKKEWGREDFEKRGDHGSLWTKDPRSRRTTQRIFRLAVLKRGNK